MGFDFDSVHPGADLRLKAKWMPILLDGLNGAGLLDWSVWPPQPGPDVERTLEDPPTEDWPFGVELSEDELAFFGFRSKDPGLVAGAKLTDNALWLITPAECRLIHELCQGFVDRSAGLWLGANSTDRLIELGVDVADGAELTRALDQAFGDFAALAGKSADLGGFWAY